ncbi:unnamed protein product, partial [Ixodes pacificus]
PGERTLRTINRVLPNCTIGRYTVCFRVCYGMAVLREKMSRQNRLSGEVPHPHDFKKSFWRICKGTASTGVRKTLLQTRSSFKLTVGWRGLVTTIVHNDCCSSSGPIFMQKHSKHSML